MRVGFVCPNGCGGQMVNAETLGGGRYKVSAPCEGCNRRFTYEGDPMNFSPEGCTIEVIDPDKEPEPVVEGDLTEEVLGEWKKHLSDAMCPVHNIPMVRSTGIGKASCPQCLTELLAEQESDPLYGNGDKAKPKEPKKTSNRTKVLVSLLAILAAGAYASHTYWIHLVPKEWFSYLPW